MTATTKIHSIRIGDLVSSDAGTIVVQAAPDLQIVYADPSELVVDLGDRPPAVTGFKPGDLAKRALDVTVAVVALLFSLPVWVVVVLVAGLGEGGPILFSQQRIGQGGQMFRCWKFRTMYVDADQVLDRLLASDLELARQWNEDHKLDDDPRVTKLGRFLRRFDLDEIPQFVNILIGDMSVVGPRPVVLKEASRFAEHLPAVLSVRPGLTGIWQISGRNSMSYGERVRQEANYVADRSFFGDVAICARTPMALLRRNGGR